MTSQPHTLPPPSARTMPMERSPARAGDKPWRISTHEHRVAFAECDPAGIAHYSNFYRWFDESVHTLLCSIGWDWNRTQRDFGWIGLALAQAEARFVRPVTPAMALRIETCVERVESRRVHVAHSVISGDTLVCEGRETRFVGVRDATNPDRIRAIDLPPDFVNALRAD